MLNAKIWLLFDKYETLIQKVFLIKAIFIQTKTLWPIHWKQSTFKKNDKFMNWTLVFLNLKSSQKIHIVIEKITLQKHCQCYLISVIKWIKKQKAGKASSVYRLNSTVYSREKCLCQVKLTVVLFVADTNWCSLWQP